MSYLLDFREELHKKKMRWFCWRLPRQFAKTLDKFDCWVEDLRYVSLNYVQILLLKYYPGAIFNEGKILSYVLFSETRMILHGLIKLFSHKKGHGTWPLKWLTICVRMGIILPNLHCHCSTIRPFLTYWRKYFVYKHILMLHICNIIHGFGNWSSRWSVAAASLCTSHFGKKP